jgi:3-oxoacyl-[acyl-carrier-protein] synthase-1
MRPVFVTHTGLWCAAGATPAAIRRALAAPKPPRGRLCLPGGTWPYAYATDPDLDCRSRLFEALAAVGPALDLPGLAPGAPVLLGTSSLLVGACEAAAGPMPDPSALLAEVRQRWGLDGRGWTFSSACASAVHALDAAVGLIECGQTEEAVVLGVELLNRSTPAGFAALQLLSPGGARPMDADRDGLVLGEAVAAVRLSARPSHWRLHAPALAFDATSPTSFAPDGSTISAVMASALAQAGRTPESIRAVKLQASGALATDAAEAAALRTLFDGQPPPLFSMKGALGHTLGASGLAELVAALFCLEEGWVPATSGFATADPALGLRPTREPEPWTPGPILFNLQGFGGCLGSWIVEPA